MEKKYGLDGVTVYCFCVLTYQAGHEDEKITHF